MFSIYIECVQYIYRVCSVYIYMHTHTHTHMYIERERERERESVREREREREREIRGALVKTMTRVNATAWPPACGESDNSNVTTAHQPEYRPAHNRQTIEKLKTVTQFNLAKPPERGLSLIMIQPDIRGS